MVRSETWRWGYRIGIAIACAAVAFSDSEAMQGLLVLWSILCTLGLAVAAWRMADRPKRIYLGLSLSGFLIVTGAVARTLIGEAIGVDQPLPSLADFLTAPGYVIFAVVALTIHRIRAASRNIDAWLDSIALTAAVFLVFWATFLADFVTNGTHSGNEIALSTFYNAVVFAAGALLARIGATPGHRPPSYQLLGIAGLSFVVADIFGAVSDALGATLFITLALSPVVYGFGLAAAWHPSAEHIADRPELQEEEIGRFRFGLSAIAAATPALVATLSPVQSGIGRLGMIVLSVLIAVVLVVRITRLLISQRDVASLEYRLTSTLSNLTGLDSPTEVAQNLRPASQSIFGPDTKLVLGEGPPTANGSVAINNLLTPTLTEGHATLIPASIDPARKRVFASFVRDAGAIAASKEAIEIQARERSQAEANRQIAANERRFRALVQHSSDVVAVLAPSGDVTYISDSCEHLLGYPADKFLGQDFEWIAHENDWDFARDYLQATLEGTESHREHELRATHKDGSTLLLDIFLSDMRDVEEINGLVLNITDVTEKRNLERHLLNAETTDSLTMLLNRTAFIRETDVAIRRASVSETSVAMAIINIDDFRLINEGYGTAVADQLLVDLAYRINQSVRIDDVVARLNGDEFGVLMPSGHTAVEAEAIISRVLEHISEPIMVAGRAVALQATAGLVLNHAGQKTGICMLRDADTALDIAKQASRGSLVHFDQAMGEEVTERVELRNLLRDAIANDKLRLAYQPVVNMDTGKIVSLEALSRWTDPDRGIIEPRTFIPIAEAAGMISELGEWALRTACEDLVTWTALGFDDISLSVNMSGHQIREENVITTVRNILEETNVDPTRITIEITESILIDDTDFIADRISALRALGPRLAIDDFGTGYSSLSYLRRYEFDILKIDRSFVIPLVNDINKREREIVNAMIKLAQALGAKTVAEGIEENEEYAVLRTLGCDHAQGFLFWRPLEQEDVLNVLRAKPLSVKAA